ncbi:heterokaryon incompatibility protein-domain-containing protein, partial [Lasiosphaeris hirsuta]
MEPRLVHTADITSTAPPRYTTLSHCWGKLDIQAHAAMTTTRDTLKSRLEEMPLAGLPRSFQDAIKVTRDLGIPYVWIDSLCIIQTGWGRADPEAGKDWIRESSKMGAIYRNSECCLIATASPDSHGGFFVEKVELPPVVFDDEDYDALGIGDPPQSPHSDPPWDYGFGSEMMFVATLDTMANSGPVSKRGWCLQERYLSPRALHFTKHGLVWECHAVALERTGEAKFSGRALDRWDAIIADFSSRALTQASDRLPAVAGLAQEVARATGATYLAGLWDRNLLRWLCWNV